MTRLLQRGESLIRLQRDGLVEIEPYRGARVLEPAEADIREILELRLLIECQIARDLAARRPPEVLDALAASVDVSRAFSDILAEACGNSRMLKLLVDLRSVLLLIGNTSLRAPGREERSIAEHEAIVAALRAGDPETADAATERHIHSIEHDSLDPA